MAAQSTQMEQHPKNRRTVDVSHLVTDMGCGQGAVKQLQQSSMTIRRTQTVGKFRQSLSENHQRSWHVRQIDTGPEPCKSEKLTKKKKNKGTLRRCSPMQSFSENSIPGKHWIVRSPEPEGSSVTNFPIQQARPRGPIRVPDSSSFSAPAEQLSPKRQQNPGTHLMLHLRVAPGNTRYALVADM